MKAFKLFAAVVVFANYYTQIQMIEAEQYFKHKTNINNNIKKRQLSFGNVGLQQYNRYNWPKLADCYDPGFTRQQDVPPWNAISTENKHKYQVMYAPQLDYDAQFQHPTYWGKRHNYQLAQQPTLLSTPFKFYKLHLPNRLHQRLLSNLGNTAPHAFPKTNLQKEPPHGIRAMNPSYINNAEGLDFFNDKYMPIKPLHLPTDERHHKDHLQAPFRPSTFLGYSTEFESSRTLGPHEPLYTQNYQPRLPQPARQNLMQGMAKGYSQYYKTEPSLILFRSHN